MKKCLLFSAGLFLLNFNSEAQTTLAQWNFNSNPADASNTTGSNVTSIGSGTILNVGTVTNTFASGTASGGSSDTVTVDNTGYQTTTYPAQGTGNKTSGIQVNVSTVGYEQIKFRFDLRSSNTSSKYLQIQYCTDVTASSPVWTDFDTTVATSGDMWVNGRVKDFSAITALNNNPNAGFRIVSMFGPDNTNYVASTSGSTYGTSSTLRFDMVTVTGLVPSSPVPNVDVQFVGNFVTVSEDSTQVGVVAKLVGNHPSPSSVFLKLSTLSTATLDEDFSPIDSVKFEWQANSDNVTDTVFFNIANDTVSERTEYFIVNFENGTNINIPAPANNIFTVFIQDNDKPCVSPANAGSLNYVTSFSNGTAGTNSAEIVDYDSVSRRLFIANSIGGKVDIVNFSNPATPTLISSITINPTYGNLNSLAVRNGIVAVAVENLNPQANGQIVFFDTNGTYINAVNAGAMPDMVAFSPDGNKIVVANEGEPNAAYSNDPQGTVTVIDISSGVANASATQVDFTNFNADSTSLKASGVRIYGPNATVAQDLEPEYISFSADGLTAFVSCQENNAIAVLDLATKTITSINPLGYKDYSLEGNGLDASDQSGAVHIANWPIKGVYMPDAISTFQSGGVDYIICANEGDARAYTGFSEEKRLSSATYLLDTLVFPNHLEIKKNIGRINVTTASGDANGDGYYEEIHTYGARSISIRVAATGELVWDSGDQLEQMIACHPTWKSLFNASNANNTFKNRSDDKGPEPEGVTTKTIGTTTYAFVTLERMGGVVIYDVTNPTNPILVDYLNSRNPSAYGGDNGAEGILVIRKPATSGTTVLAGEEYYVIAANEVSSTLAIYGFTAPEPLPITMGDISGKHLNGNDIITWTLNAKGENNKCELLHSTNGFNFTSINSYDVNENNTNYNYTNYNPVSNENFYRVKLVDESGKVSYSKIITLTKNIDEKNTVFPNPTSDNLFITSNSANTKYKIMNIQGHEVSNGILNKGVNKINILNLESGTYILIVDGNPTSTKFIKL